MRPARLLGAVCILGCIAGGAWAREPSAERGQALARAHCARCHAIGMTGASRLPAAPAFRTLHHRYPVEQLAEALAEGIQTGHAAMPEFRFDPGRIGDLIAYFRTLER
jgi:mono/diheme cytochrome c family protein